jgi:TPR repeat protein
MKRFRSARIGIGIREPILVFSALLATASARPAAAQQYSGAVAANCLAADLPRERYQPPPPAEKGDSAAQANVGYIYDHGVAVAEDRVAAAAWYRKAAEAGEALAQNNLGDMYCHGEGVPLDYAEAFRWFQRAAEQGYTGRRSCSHTCMPRDAERRRILKPLTRGYWRRLSQGMPAGRN